MDLPKIKLRQCKSHSKVLQFPGCFDLEAKMFVSGNSPLTKNWAARPGAVPNWLMQADWAFRTGVEGKKSHLFDDFNCKHQDINNCNGIGNNCYYCNFCKSSLQQVQKAAGLKKKYRVGCPTKAGYSVLKKRNIGLDSWGELDKDKDGEPDFVCYDEFKPYRSFLDNNSGSGYGTITLTVRIAQNNTKEWRKMKSKLTHTALGKWHKQRLPEIMKTRLLGCGVSIFDVCLRKPYITNGQLTCG
jgi:hypothetical protein